MRSAGARNGLWYLPAEAELLSGAGVDVWHLREPPGEPGGAVKFEHVTRAADAWQGVAYGKLWTFFPLTCTLAKYRKVVFWGRTSKTRNKGKGCSVKRA